MSERASEWTANEETEATRRIPDGARSFDSGVLEAQGVTFSDTFATEATADHYCSPQESLGMVGRVACGEPGGPAAEGSIPDSPGSGVVLDSERIVGEPSIASPFVPGGLEPLPWQFWAGAGVFGTVSAYRHWMYDRESDR